MSGNHWSRKNVIVWLVIALLALFIWVIETDRIIDRAEPDAVSCATFKENINYRRGLFPKELSPAELCRLTPPECGPTGMIFNPDGMETYYYQAQCYADLAQSTLDEEFCDRVVERRSLFFDGTYYSRGACLKRVRQFKLDEATVKIDPQGIARIDTVTTMLVPDEVLTITLTLAPEALVHGQYAIDAALHFAVISTGRTTAVTLAINPVHPAIRRDSSYSRLRPLSYWVLALSPALGNTLSVNYPVTDQMRDYFQRATTDEMQLAVQLQFLESDDGALADPAERRDAYISKQMLAIPLNTSGL